MILSEEHLAASAAALLVRTSSSPADVRSRRSPFTIPGHAGIKVSTFRTVCTHAGIPRMDFLDANENA
jgi:hypothetical protein